MEEENEVWGYGFILGFFTINEMFLSQLLIALYNLSLLWPLILIISYYPDIYILVTKQISGDYVGKQVVLLKYNYTNIFWGKLYFK